jgi:hypothetical protein
MQQYPSQGRLVAFAALLALCAVACPPRVEAQVFRRRTVEVKVVGGTGSGTYRPGEKVALIAAPPAVNMVFAEWSTENWEPVTIEPRVGASATMVVPRKAVTVVARYVSKGLTTLQVRYQMAMDGLAENCASGSVPQDACDYATEQFVAVYPTLSEASLPGMQQSLLESGTQFPVLRDYFLFLLLPKK